MPITDTLYMKVDPAAVGVSSSGTAQIERIFQTEVDRGVAPGIVILISRHGRLAFSAAVGYRDPIERALLTVDTPFRLASMTKPVVSVAAMMLVELGRLHLCDPVSTYLPQFKDSEVVLHRHSEALNRERRVRAHREITVQDLLRHTAGFTYGDLSLGTSERSLHALYAHANLLDPGQTGAQFLQKLAQLPLLQHPGTTFEYGVSTDVLGHLIEVVTGLPLDEHIEQVIARPLRLKSFTFQVSAASARGLARASDKAENAELNVLNAQLAPQRWISGGGGLISNATDYLRFAQMLLNGGELDGARLLSPKTVALMTSDALCPGARYGRYTDTLGPLAPTPAMGQSFGLGFSVRVAAGRNPLPGSTGDYAWAGRWGTYFWVDPTEQLACVLLTQAPANRVHFRSLARTLVYQALL